MPLTNGTYTLGPDNGRLTVRTYREGFGSKVGHDLVLEATRWSGTADVNVEDPAASKLSLTVDARSFDVVEATGGVKPFGDKDKKDVLKNIDEKVLDTSKHPEITFTSTGISADGTSADVSGQLTITGQTRPVTAKLTAEDQGGTVRVRGTIPVTQSQWGIKPFSAMLGALKVKDTIEVDVEANLAPR